jgi:cyclohexanone monooxygenase
MTQPQTSNTHYDAVVVGAGFAGLYMLHRLRLLGLRAHLFEAGDGVGGTWYWNCYPGARCDVDSMQYSYSWSPQLQQEWQWTERYPAQEEILRYINHVADRFDLRRDITLSTRIVGGHWQAAQQRWQVRTEHGQEVSTQFLITATGCLSESRLPAIEGLEDFKGRIYHTGRWPKTPVDFTGLRVGVMGTGSSGIQAIPQLAKQAKQLYVFQRTPNFSVPAWNGPIDPAHQQDWLQHYPEYRAKARSTRSAIMYDYGTQSALEMAPQARLEEMERRWRKGGTNFAHSFNDTFTNRQSNELLSDFVRGKIRQMVHDPEVAQKLLPHDHAIGTKRICVDTGYYETYNLPHVKLIDLRKTPIERFDATAAVADGQRLELDAMVFATGFDAVTGALERLNIVGEHGRTFKQLWQAGPTSYLGLMTVGFPNLFTITGPGSPSILTNVIISIEQHVEWIADCLAFMQKQGHTRIDPQQAAQDRWVGHVQEVAAGTLFVTANSWYMGANIPGKPKVFLPYIGGFSTYVARCEEVVRKGYEGFDFSSPKAAKRQAAASSPSA